MWNTDTWRNSEEDAVAENHASAGTSEDQANPSSTKRQRRPNVRLEELGEQHTSPSADKRKKKTGKARVCMSNGGLHKQRSFDVGDNAQGADNGLPCCVNGPADPCPASEKTTKLQKILKITSKKVRNGCRKPGAPKVGASAKKLPCAPRSGTSIRAHCKQKAPRKKQDAKDMHFDKENNTHSPALFEASGYQDVISPFGRRERGDVVLLHSHQNFQSGDYLPARAQGRGSRGERAHQWTQSSSRMQAFKLIGDADGKRMAHATSPLHVPKGKLVVKAKGSMHGTRNKLAVEANGNGDCRESSKMNAVRQCWWPWPGVREWLQDLGLGQYAHIFEAHEVEPEVLPLLTLDDLREMGVAAVGSRRKMFSAIQHIRKALMAESE